MIKAAPVSFFIVCLVLGGLMWTGFHFIYKGRLEDAHELSDHWMGESQHWQSDADYWKDMASHPTVEVKPATPAPPAEATKPIAPPTPINPKKSSGAPSPMVSPKPPQVIGENSGIAIGGNNTGIATVNNIGRVPRSLSDSQVSILGTAITTPNPNYEGIL